MWGISITIIQGSYRKWWFIRRCNAIDDQTSPAKTFNNNMTTTTTTTTTTRKQTEKQHQHQ